MINGFLRVAATSPEVVIANPVANARIVIDEALRLDSLGVEIAVFPELNVTGYTCGDLFHNYTLLDASRKALEQIASELKDKDIDIIVGAPVVTDCAIKNCAIFISKGEMMVFDKTYLPSYNEFYERRWFAPANIMTGSKTVRSHGVTIGVEICEDLWTPIPPSSYSALAGAEVIFNLSASDDVVGKYKYLRTLIKQQSARCICGYVYSSCGWGESTTDLVFSPKDIVAEVGVVIAENDRFDVDAKHQCAIADIDVAAIRRERVNTTSFSDCSVKEGNAPTPLPTPFDENWDYNFYPEYRHIDPMPFVPSDPEEMEMCCKEVIFIQQSGLARRLQAIGCKTLTLGISGGLDSTLALLVAVEAFDRLKLPRTGIIGVTMPGFGTSGRTYNNAIKMMERLGVTIREVPIAKAVMQHFEDIGHNPDVTDVTFENSQARERTQILMDIANQTGGIVLGTGDLSELALGWATYNGDQMSMYGVNAGVPKTLVQHLVKCYAGMCKDKEVREVLLDVVDTPISPELTPADEHGNIKQVTEDLVGPYQLHDFFIFYTLRCGFSPQKIFMLARKAFEGTYDTATILKWMRTFYRRFFSQQFKRSCLPDGPKVGSVCLSPRGDWRMPSDASAKLWLQEIDLLTKNLENNEI